MLSVFSGHIGVIQVYAARKMTPTMTGVSVYSSTTALPRTSKVYMIIWCCLVLICLLSAFFLLFCVFQVLQVLKW